MQCVFNHEMNYNMITPLELNSWLNPIPRLLLVVTNVLNYISWINHKLHGLINHILPYCCIATNFESAV